MGGLFRKKIDYFRLPSSPRLTVFVESIHHIGQEFARIVHAGNQRLHRGELFCVAFANFFHALI